MLARLSISPKSQGLHDITELVQNEINKSGVREGLCTVMIQHTSASLLIQENADPSAKRDIEAWFNRLVVENDPLYTHTAEGPDDMPSHIKATLTATSLSVPIVDGRLALGTWQGLCLFEHRRQAGARQCIVHITS